MSCSAARVLANPLTGHNALTPGCTSFLWAHRFPRLAPHITGLHMAGLHHCSKGIPRSACTGCQHQNTPMHHACAYLPCASCMCNPLRTRAQRTPSFHGHRLYTLLSLPNGQNLSTAPTGLDTPLPCARRPASLSTNHPGSCRTSSSPPHSSAVQTRRSRRRSQHRPPLGRVGKPTLNTRNAHTGAHRRARQAVTPCNA